MAGTMDAVMGLENGVSTVGGHDPESSSLCHKFRAESRKVFLLQAQQTTLRYQKTLGAPRRLVTLSQGVTECYILSQLWYRIILIMHQNFKGTDDMHYYNFNCNGQVSESNNPPIQSSAIVLPGKWPKFS